MTKSLFIAVALLLGNITFAQNAEVDTQKSIIKWVGKKVTGQHDGTLKLKEGSLSMKDGKLTGGMFIIDMTTLNCTDLKGGKKADLEGHLAGDDFFSIEKYKTAKLSLNKVSDKGNGNYLLAGNMTIKGITKPVILNAMVSKEGSGYKATSKFSVNRTMFGIKYKSSSFFNDLKNRAINDDFDLEITLFTK